ncbi:hypothetical protein NDA11_003531 [Ustilago hordei]|uniref:Mitochondrial import receptor subunit TOM20 n=1 Tax=Ustilago hordei TaxID=120017 RepID=I2G620_USTHO|nr:uncharacterized protein UHO2_01862 [Ustilago hordei]KAJ1039268.1 hypothetical protein NDA10_006809 [Ustilago hordei]KAJ1585676.1 hypothetical protein NDA12_000580 [Ustilago hordei]KAJ1589446.1 hypothetical protein NDA15_005437 [Ustilago hordei]KAJ1590867.1 hypothetical protein NDA11_003531 [Ustilago hordei]KAJ1601145.1 hypothetical protein NDA14_007518 [Ustilago hordei]
MKTSQIILTSLSVLGVAGMGYAIYFDHRRRTDPAFRKGLKKESKKLSKVEKEKAAKRAQQEDGFIQDLLQEVRTPGIFPAGVEEREQYFLKYVSLGEQLFAMGTDKYLEAAAAFYKALKVYPKSIELIMIYEKAVPKEVFDTIMRIVSKEIATGGEGQESMTAAGLDEVDDDGPSPSAAAAAKKAQAEDDDDEEDDDKTESKEASASTSAKPAQQQGTDSGTTSSQEWDTLSATSLNETGVMVTPNAPASTASESPESSAATAEEEETATAAETTGEPKLTSIDTSASLTKEPVSTPSKQNFTSGWSPAPVFSGSSPRAEKKADPFSGAQDNSE